MEEGVVETKKLDLRDAVDIQQEIVRPRRRNPR